MRTFGHSGDAGHHGYGDHATATERAAMMMITDVGREAADRPAIARILDATGRDGMGGGLFVVCLAVLGALGLVLWAAVARGQARDHLLRLCPVGRARRAGPAGLLASG
jgi:hypothetical protein